MEASYPQEREHSLVNRLEKAIALTTVLSKEFQFIRNESLMLGAEWSSSVESLLAHLEIDLDWLSKEFRQIRG